MNKIKETITTLTSGEVPSVARINRREKTPITDQRLEMILKCAIKVAVIVGGVVLVLNAGIVKLLAVIGFVLFFSLIYSALKN